MIGTLPNPRPDQRYTVTVTGNLTCRCPVNGMEDSALIQVDYQPAASLIEYGAWAAFLASLVGTTDTHEAITCRLLDAFVEAAAPRFVLVQTIWTPIEGVAVTVKASLRTDGRRASCT